VKIGIIGSEASRGIFMFNAFQTAMYKLQIVSYQTTTVSNMAPPVEKPMDYSSYPAWDKMIVEGNLTKAWGQRLSDFAPDAVVIDFVSDVMYPSVEYSGSLVTKNPMLMKHLKSSISTQAAAHTDDDSFVKAWSAAAELMIKAIREIRPETLVVLHSAQLLNTYVDKEGIPRKVRKGDVSRSNALLKRMNAVAEQWVDIVLSSDPLKFHGYELHPWGIGPAKYEFKYNTHMLGLFANKVLESRSGGRD